MKFATNSPSFDVTGGDLIKKTGTCKGENKNKAIFK